MIRTLTALMAVAGKFGISTITRGKIEISMPLNGDRVSGHSRTCTDTELFKNGDLYD